MTNVKVKHCVLVLNTAIESPKGTASILSWRADHITQRAGIEYSSITRTSIARASDGICWAHLLPHVQTEGVDYDVHFLPCAEERTRRVGMLSLDSSLRCKDY